MDYSDFFTLGVNAFTWGIGASAFAYLVGFSVRYVLKFFNLF